MAVNRNVVTAPSGPSASTIGGETAKIQFFTHGQSTILKKSLLIAGIVFIVVCAIGFGINQWVIGLINTDIEVAASTLLTLYIVSMVGLIITMVLVFLIRRRITTVSTTFIVISYVIYCAVAAIVTGILFTAFALTWPGNEYLKHIIYVFGIMGGIFFLAGLIGMFVSDAVLASIGKFIMIIFIVYMIGFLIVIFPFAFGVAGFDSGLVVIYLIGGVLDILYIIYEVGTIKRMEPFVRAQTADVQFKIVLMCAFAFTVDLFQLLWRIGYLYLQMQRR